MNEFWNGTGIYLVAIAIPFGFAHPVPTLIILGVSAACFAVVKAYRWQRRVRALQALPDQLSPVAAEWLGPPRFDFRDHIGDSWCSFGRHESRHEGSDRA